MIYKIVVTGGVCAGKTSFMARIQERLEGAGIPVFLVPEMASIFITGGIRPWQVGPVAFQGQLLRAIMQLENVFVSAARAKLQELEQSKVRLFSPVVVVVFDRGVIDNRAFVSTEEWEAIMNESELSTVYLRDKRYDAVIHLVSAAIGAEAHFNHDNPARTETVEQAAANDRRIRQAWTGCPNLTVIDNCFPDFDAKMLAAENAVMRLISYPDTGEIKRTFLLHGSLLGRRWWPGNFMPDQEPVVAEIRDTYLENEQGNQERIRVRGIGATKTYYHTIKVVQSDNSRRVQDRQITGTEYMHLLHNRVHVGSLEKVRSYICSNAGYIEIDAFTAPAHLTGIMLVGFTPFGSAVDGGLSNLKDYFARSSTLEDVTNDRNYYNVHLLEGQMYDQ